MARPLFFNFVRRYVGYCYIEKRRFSSILFRKYFCSPTVQKLHTHSSILFNRLYFATHFATKSRTETVKEDNFLPPLTDDAKAELKLMLDRFAECRPYSNRGKTEIITFAPYFIYHYSLNDYSIFERFVDVFEDYWSRTMPLISIRHSKFGYRAMPAFLKFSGELHRCKNGGKFISTLMKFKAVDFIIHEIVKVGLEYFDANEILDCVSGLKNLFSDRLLILEFLIALDEYACDFRKERAAEKFTKFRRLECHADLWRKIFRTYADDDTEFVVEFLKKLSEKTCSRPSDTFLSFLRDFLTEKMSKTDNTKPRYAMGKLSIGAANMLDILRRLGVHEYHDRFLINDCVRLFGKGLREIDECEKYAEALTIFANACCDFRKLPIRVDENTWTRWFECVEKTTIFDVNLLLAIVRVIVDYRRFNDFNRLENRWSTEAKNFLEKMSSENVAILNRYVQTLTSMKRETVKIDSEFLEQLKRKLDGTRAEK